MVKRNCLFQVCCLNLNLNISVKVLSEGKKIGWCEGIKGTTGGQKGKSKKQDISRNCKSNGRTMGEGGLNE